MKLSVIVTSSPPMSAAFSQAVISERRIVKPSEPIPTWQFFCPAAALLISPQSSTTRPVLFDSIRNIALLRMRDPWFVPFEAFTTPGREKSRASTTVPAVLIVIPPDGVRLVPAGTPVFDASGQPDDGGG